MNPHVAELDAILDGGDRHRCLDFLAALSPKERRGLAALARKRFDEFHDGEWAETAPDTQGWRNAGTDQQCEAAAAAVMGTCSEGEVAKLDGRALDVAVEVWQRLRPEFLPRAADLVIACSPHFFSLARDLWRLGLSDRPTHDNYVLAMVAQSFVPYRGDQTLALLDHLRTMPDLLEHEVWRLFEVEGGGENSLAAHDKFTHDGRTWANALLVLMNEGTLDRARVIDATLGALERDFAAFRAGWFSRFYAQLDVADDERASRSSRILGLAGSAIPATVALALDEITKLEKHAPVSAAELTPVLAPVTLARHKSTAKQSLKLLGAIAKRDASAKPEVGRAIVLALGHEAADVQKVALDLLDKIGDRTDAELVERVRAAAPSVAASLQKRLAAWAPTPTTRPAVPAPMPRVFEPRARKSIAPLTSLDELIFAFAHVLEDDEDPMEVERVLDGVSRFHERPRDFGARTSPLVKRARKLVERPSDRPVAHCLSCVALAWTAEPGQARASLDRVAPRDWKEKGQENVSFATLLLLRCRELADRRDGGLAGELLSLPTERGGFLAPETLAGRIEGASKPGELDAMLALLRVPESERARLAKSLPPAPAIAHAVEARVRETSWEVAARKSGPYTFHDLALDAKPRAKGSKRADRPADLLYHGKRWERVAGWHKSLVRWACTVWPEGSEAYFFEALPTLAGNIDWSAAEWANVAYYELLRDMPNELGALACVTLAIGLAAKEPGENGVCTDAAIAALGEGRVSGRALGDAMARLRETGMVNLKRWSRTLGVVARTSGLHSSHVRSAIERTLRGVPKQAPRDEGALVALLAELCAEESTTIRDPEAWAYLSASRHEKVVRDFAP